MGTKIEASVQHTLGENRTEVDSEELSAKLKDMFGKLIPVVLGEDVELPSEIKGSHLLLLDLAGNLEVQLSKGNQVVTYQVKITQK